MKYDPEIHHRQSIRLKEFDYSQNGAYFVTVCTHNRECLFCEIADDEMKLNDAGRMVKKWFYELENKFIDIQCDEMIVMPNHIHFIVNNISMENIAKKTVGADLRVCPFLHSEINGEHAGSPLHKTSPIAIMGEHAGSPLHKTSPIATMGEHAGSPLRSVVRWLKTMTTNDYIRGVKNNGWRRFNGKLWQRNYWEHVIRNEKSLENIRNYIINNPKKWAEDENNIAQIEKEYANL